MFWSTEEIEGTAPAVTSHKILVFEAPGARIKVPAGVKTGVVSTPPKGEAMSMMPKTADVPLVDKKQT